MTSARVADLLEAQAAAWRQGRDETGSLVERALAERALAEREAGPSVREAAGEAVALLWLGQALYRALVPVAPRPAFVMALGEALRAGSARVAAPPPTAPSTWLTVAAVGSALSLTGLLWWRRRARLRHAGNPPGVRRPAVGQDGSAQSPRIGQTGRP